MFEHVLRVFRADARSWTPTIVVVALVTALIGACANQFVWTHSTAFTGAAVASGLDPREFSTVSVTVYAMVAALTFFALTVVGAATVERTRGTFALWRLAGASPRQVRVGLWSLTCLASIAGALPGSLASIGVSAVAVPLFNQMAAMSFAGGAASFEAPAFRPSAMAWAVSFVAGVATCMSGAFLSSRRAARVEAVRGPEMKGSRAE